MGEDCGLRSREGSLLDTPSHIGGPQRPLGPKELNPRVHAPELASPWGWAPTSSHGGQTRKLGGSGSSESSAAHSFPGLFLSV